MRTVRLLLDDPVDGPGVLDLPADRARYVARVLRAKPGTPVVVADGRGGEIPGEVEAVDGQRVRLRLADRRASASESPLAITLVLAVTKGERMDVAVQKSVELGVARIVPVFTEHCVVRLDGARAEKRRQHWQEVARSAGEQSGRDRAPRVETPASFADWLTTRPPTTPGLVLDPRADHPVERGVVGDDSHLDLLVGPEGGLSDEEVARASDAGLVPVRLGPRVLRAETAAIAALTAVQFVLGDLGH